MKKTINIMFFGLGLVLLSSCLKDKLDPESISGTWQFNEVQLLGNVADSSAKLIGTFTFAKSTSTYNAGGTVYGDFCDGKGDFPVLFQTQNGPAQLSKNFLEFKLTKGQEPGNYNYLNFYTGTYGYLFQGLNYYGSIRMSLVSNDKMNIQLERSQNSDIRFNIMKIKLTKI